MNVSPAGPAVIASVGLRPWILDDAEPLAAMYAAAYAELALEQPWRPPSFFTSTGQRERISRSLGEDSVECFVITEAGTVAGSLTLAEIKRDILQSADIGYWVDPDRRRRGLATSAIALAVDHAFTRLRLHRLHATVGLENIASWQALESNAFHRVGVVRDFAFVRGSWRDHYLYQRTAGR